MSPRYRIEEELGSPRVVRAFDERHGRPVALKRGDPAAIGAEARTLARLAHPGIVALYEHAAEGFLALRLVDGRAIEPRAADAHRLLAACEAVAHAHERGVAHGALEASHVLAGRWGETVVVGWSRAAEGGDPRPDVVALGRLLAELPAAPADVRAIAARAQAAGYPDAGALAADLRRWAAGQLVAARPYSFAALARRWLGRHRALAAALLCAALGAGVFGAAGVAGVVEERDLADRTAARADAARADAAARRDASDALVGALLGGLEGKLAAVGQLALLESGAQAVLRHAAAIAGSPHAAEAPALGHLATALDILAQVERDRHDAAAALAIALAARDVARRALLGPDGLAPLAAAHRLVALTANMLDDRSALAAETAGLALAAAAPGQARLVAEAYDDFAMAFSKMGDRRTHIAALRARRAVLERLVAAGPPNADLLLDLGDADMRLGQVLWDFASVAAVREALAAGQAAHERAAALRHDATTEMALSRSEQLLAAAAADAGDLDAARAGFGRCIARRQRLIAGDPGNVEWRLRLTYCLAALAVTETEALHLPAALAIGARAVAIDTALLRDRPDAVFLQRAVALMLAEHNGTLIAAGRHAEAAAAARRGLAVTETLRAREPGRGYWVMLDSWLRATLAESLLGLGDLPAARAAATRAVADAAAIAAASPAEVAFVWRRAAAGLLLGRVELAAGRPGEARAALEPAVAAFDDLLARQGDRLRSVAEAAEAQQALAAALARLGDREGARARNARARAIAATLPLTPLRVRALGRAP